MNVIQCRDCLEFHDDTAFHEQVYGVLAYYLIIIINRGIVLLPHIQPRFPQFQNERVLIHFFQKSAAGHIAHLLCAADNFPGNPVKIRSAYIGGCISFRGFRDLLAVP